MTNHWNDLANSDCILIMGSNPAENHPISFKWVLKAQDKGAKVVSVDPRFTHSSSKADFYVQLRVGTDIAFLGGMINYILNNDKYFKQYVIDSTNGPTVVGERFGFSDGLFSGFNADKKSYDKKTWAFEIDANGVPVRDETLTHPRCVLQLLKKHYDRYTLDKVSETTGTPKEDLLRVYETFASTGAPDKAGTIMYAMGWTQKSVGVQNIRAMSIIQLLLGNIGVAGGGVNALRGESNVQGSTDQALLADIWPGYLPVPTSTLTTLADYNATTPKTNDPKSVNWWGNRPKYTASFLMSLYPGVTPDVAYSYVPRLDADKKRTDYMWMSIFDRMVEGKLDGLFAWGMNPACSGPNANKSRGAMEKLKWLVNVNLFDNETGSFWRGPGKDPTQIVTQGVTLVPEGRRIFPDMTVLENLKIGAYLRKDDLSEDLEWVYSLFPRLKERSWQAGGTLSGGEQQMLAVGRALMSRPKLLMMDEPSLGLAPLVVRDIFSIIQEINKQGVTILLIEQNANMALKIADIGYVLETGRITLTGSGEELLTNDAVRAAYLGA